MGESRITTRAFYKKITIFPDFRHAMSLRISSTFDSRAFQGVLDAYKNGAKFHRLVRNSTVQSTERVKFFQEEFFPGSRTGRRSSRGFLRLFLKEILILLLAASGKKPYIKDSTFQTFKVQSVRFQQRAER